LSDFLFVGLGLVGRTGVLQSMPVSSRDRFEGESKSKNGTAAIQGGHSKL
jgi:hypothetical protein